MHKKIFLLVLLIFAVAILPAQTDYSNYYPEFFKSMSRYDFINFFQSCCMDEIVYMVAEIFEDLQVDKCFQITEDNVDEEDMKMMANLQNCIVEKYNVQDRDSYESFVFRSVDETSMDGWFVFSHYSESATDKWFHYIFYFSVSE